MTVLSSKYGPRVTGGKNHVRSNTAASNSSRGQLTPRTFGALEPHPPKQRRNINR